MSSEIVQAPSAAPAVISEELRRMAQFFKAVLPNGQRLSDQEALAAAAYAKATGLDPTKGEFYVIPGRGIVPGYRGEMKSLAERDDYYYQFRPLTADEVALHEVKPEDYAAACEVVLIRQARALRDLGITYRPVLGIGIVRKAETVKAEEWRDTPQGRRLVKLDPPVPIEPPTGRSWYWKAQQRALKDALRHAGVELPTLDEELAEAETRAQATVQRVAQMSADELRQTLRANVNAMRGDPADDPFVAADQPPAEPPAAEPPPAEQPSAEPLSATAIRARLHERIASSPGWMQSPANEARCRQVNGAFAVAVPDDAQRRALRGFLLGDPDRTTYTVAEAAVYTGWLDITKDPATGKWRAGVTAAQEIPVLLQHITGQMTLIEEAT